MSVLGIHVLTGQLLYAVLDGTKQIPELIEKNKLIPISTHDVGELMNWFETNFERLISQHNPSKISYRLTLNPAKDQLINLEFPLGILHLICYRQHISTCSYTAGSYVPSKLGLAKGVDLYNYCDTLLGKNPPYWDKNLKNAVLAAWFELP